MLLGVCRVLLLRVVVGWLLVSLLVVDGCALGRIAVCCCVLLVEVRCLMCVAWYSVFVDCGLLFVVVCCGCCGLLFAVRCCVLFAAC